MGTEVSISLCLGWRLWEPSGVMYEGVRVRQEREAFRAGLFPDGPGGCGRAGCAAGLLSGGRWRMVGASMVVFSSPG